MANKTELQEQLKSLGGEPGDLTVDDLKEAIKTITDAEVNTKEEETVEDNPTVKRQKAAKALQQKRAAEIAKKAKTEAAAKADSKSLSEKAGDAKEQKDTRKRFEDDRGLVFSFKYNAPKTLNIDGKSRKTSEIIEDEKVMLELVYGNSNYIEQIY